jgi:hypothetical protein
MNADYRDDFYMTRLSRRELNYTAALSSQALYTATESGQSPHLWQFLFDAAVAEMRRRTDALEQRFTEPEPLKLPNWTGRTLGNAIVDATNLTYLCLMPGVAAMADWLSWSLLIQSIAELSKQEDRENEQASR